MGCGSSSSDGHRKAGTSYKKMTKDERRAFRLALRERILAPLQAFQFATSFEEWEKLPDRGKFLFDAPTAELEKVPVEPGSPRPPGQLPRQPTAEDVRKAFQTFQFYKSTGELLVSSTADLLDTASWNSEKNPKTVRIVATGPEPITKGEAFVESMQLTSANLATGLALLDHRKSLAEAGNHTVDWVNEMGGITISRRQAFGSMRSKLPTTLNLLDVPAEDVRSINDDEDEEEQNGGFLRAASVNDAQGGSVSHTEYAEWNELVVDELPPAAT